MEKPRVLGDLVSEPTSSVSPGTHTWESRKGLLGANAWIVTGANKDFPAHLGLRRWRKRIPSRWTQGAGLMAMLTPRNTLPCCFLAADPAWPLPSSGSVLPLTKSRGACC